MLKFRQLCLLQAEILTLVVGAGVLHLGVVEPEPVELIAQVVVMVNVFPRLGHPGRARVVIAPQRIQPPRPALASPVNAAVEGFHQLGQVAFHGQPAGAVEIAERQVGVGHQRPQRLGVGQVNGKAGLALLRLDDIVVPEVESHRRRTGHARELGHQPDLVERGPRSVWKVLDGQFQHMGLRAGRLFGCVCFVGRALVHAFCLPVAAGVIKQSDQTV